jgi:putative heme-binding domain-containing protein
MIAEWLGPSPRDRVTGAWRPLAGRDAPEGSPEWFEGLAQMRRSASYLAGHGIADAPEPVVLAWIRLVRSARADDQAELLVSWVEAGERPSSVRVAALEALESLGALGLAPLIDGALGDSDGAVRAAALAALERLSPEQALARLPRVLAHGELAERRSAYAILGRIPGDDADRILAEQLDALAADLVPAELALDLVLAAEERPSSELRNRLERYRRASRQRDLELAPYLDALFGGDPERGRAVYERVDLSCTRCHATDGVDPSRVGPNLAGVGERLTRLQLLESILAPNRRTTPGYESTVVFLADGRALAGRVVERTEASVRLQAADGTLSEIPLSEVDEWRPDLSAMPEDLGEGITRAEMRDLLAWLGSL